MTRRAFEPGDRVQVKLWPLRDFAEDNYRRVDDRPYGGGPGMVMLAEPLARALAAAQADRRCAGAGGPVHADRRRRIDRRWCASSLAGPGAILLCGRYEGIDQRVLDAHVDIELSLGDFVLSGGELPALACSTRWRGCRARARRRGSHQQDNFSDACSTVRITAAPKCWARARRAAGAGGPAVGPPCRHRALAARERSLELTARRRPELIA